MMEGMQHLEGIFHQEEGAWEEKLLQVQKQGQGREGGAPRSFQEVLMLPDSLVVQLW